MDNLLSSTSNFTTFGQFWLVYSFSSIAPVFGAPQPKARENTKSSFHD
jgi:succinate-acetate transporter protein